MIMRKFLCILLILLLTFAASGEASPFEYAFVRDDGAYLLFDTDAHMALTFTHGAQPEVTRFAGSFDLFVYTEKDAGVYDLFYLRNNETAVLRDSTDSEHLYAPADPVEAAAVLARAGFSYNPENYYIREVVITKGTNARTKPDYGGSTVQWLTEGSRFPYLETKGAWHKLTLNGKEVWVPAERSKVEVY